MLVRPANFGYKTSITQPPTSNPKLAMLDTTRSHPPPPNNAHPRRVRTDPFHMLYKLYKKNSLPISSPPPTLPERQRKAERIALKQG